MQKELLQRLKTIRTIEAQLLDILRNATFSLMSGSIDNDDMYTVLIKARDVIVNLQGTDNVMYEEIDKTIKVYAKENQ